MQVKYVLVICKMIILMFGPPGVGKGTISYMLKARYGLPHISSGNIIREAIHDNGKFAIELKQFLERGQLVPDAIAINIIKERVSHDDCINGYILDGFPRTIPQAEFLDRALEESHLNINYVLNLVADERIIIERLSGRRICTKCDAIYHIKNLKSKRQGICDKCGGKLFQRDDDKPSTIRKRIKVYEEQSNPLIDFYKERKILIEIDTEKPIDEIFKDIEQKISRQS